MDEPLAVGVVGCGRMGRLHARVYSQMPQVRLAAVYDDNADAARDAAREWNTAVVGSLEELADRVRAVSIAVPTIYHLSSARPFIERGVACLIEKPLAPSSADARAIVDLRDQHNCVVQVGHIERFNPAVRAMLELDISAGFMEVTRISPLSFRSIDVGVVLDMMIHDIDIVLQLARSPVATIDATGVNVIGEAEDICNARLRFENGCVANLTASRLSLKTERKLRVFGSDAYVSIDYHKRYGIAIRKGGNIDNIRSVVDQIRRGEIDDLSEINYTDLVEVQELVIDEVEPLRAELEAFVSAANHVRPPVVTADDGLAAVVVAEQIVQAMSSTEFR